MATEAFGSWMHNFLSPAIDFGNAFMKTGDVTKEALDRFGVTPFLEAGLGMNPLTVSDFIRKDYNFLEDTVLGAGVGAFLDGDQSVINSILDGSFDYGGFLSSPSGQPSNYNNAFGVGSGALSPSTNAYFNAELAKFYGMDRNTAYQEALSNTAYQRAVVDMQRAGLNPAAIFGAGRGSGAGGVAFIGNSNSASGFSKSNSKLFESDTYGMIAALSGLATALATKRPQNFWLGQQAAQGVMQTMNVIDRKFSK